METRRKRRTHPYLYYVRAIPTQVWRHPNNRAHRFRALGRALAWQLYKRIVRRPLDVRVYSGLVLRCYPDSTSASNVIYFGAQYDINEMAFMRHYLVEGDAFVDGGANIGTYSLLAASIVGPTGRVEAFEPDPVNAARLQENVSLNALSCVRVLQAALGAEGGIVRLTADRDVSNRVIPPGLGNGPAVDVSMVTLDACLGDDPLAMAKLDLEGYEVAALRGAADHLRRSSPPVLLMEALPGQLRKAGSTVAELLELLNGFGYVTASYDAVDRKLRYQGDGTLPHGNFLAVANSAREIVAERLELRSAN